MPMRKSRLVAACAVRLRVWARKKSELAIVGDQIFTDVLCARLAGVTSVMVDPIELETFPFFRFKRALERLILRGGASGARR